MPGIKTRTTAGAIAAVAVGLAVGLAWTGAALSPPRVPDPPSTRALELTAEVVATLTGEVRTTRRGRVVAALAEPGQRVRAGNPVFEFEDLAIIDSRANLEREIAALREQVVEEPEAGLANARGGGQAVRRAALLHLEETYRLAREDFGRWQSMYDQGLVARLEYERKARELSVLKERIDEARDAARQEPEQPVTPAKARVPPELQRSERLLARLSKLPDTFLVNSPWDGTVTAINFGAGQMPRRGEALATLDRFALPKVRTDIGNASGIVALQSVCGVPGPFGFTLRDGVLETLAPSPRLRPGDACTVVAAVRK